MPLARVARASYFVQSEFGILGGQVGSGTGILADGSDATYVTTYGYDPADWPEALDDGTSDSTGSGEFLVTFMQDIPIPAGTQATMRFRARNHPGFAGGASSVAVTMGLYDGPDPNSEIGYTPFGGDDFLEVTLPTGGPWADFADTFTVTTAMATALAAGTLRGYLSCSNTDVAEIGLWAVVPISGGSQPHRTSFDP